jgi:hypothetical protein
MRLCRPDFRNLQACRGLPDEEIERLTREVYRRKPKLAYYVLFCLLVLLPVVTFSPRLSAKWFGVEIVWPLIMVALVVGVPVILFERLVIGPMVNQEMLKIVAEQGAGLGGGATPSSGQSNTMDGSPAIV